MAKVKQFDNWRVELRPETPGRLPSSRESEIPQSMQTACNAILGQVQGRVDCATAVIRRDETNVCSFCGAPWNPTSNGLPLCCHKAIDEWEAEHGKRR